MSTLLPRTLLLACALSAACGPNGTGNDPQDGGSPGTDGGTPVGGPCPAGQSGSLSICQLQNDQAAGHPTAGASVTVRGVVVTSPIYRIGNATSTLRGMFVADDGGGAYSGVLLVFDAEDGFEFDVGDTVDVTGTLDEFTGGAAGTETRVQADVITLSTTTATAEPTVISDPSVLASDDTAEPYEGVLVKVESVTMEEALPFGEFSVTGGLKVDDAIFKYSGVVAEVFASITGVMGYTAFEDGGPRLLPRSADDVVSDSRPSATIPQLLDPEAEGYLEGCMFCPGQTSTCQDGPIVLVENMVVVSQTYYITTSTSRGETFGFFVADPTAVDAEGRLLPYSGILVSVAPKWESWGESTYAFTTTGEDDDIEITDLNTVPQVGDVVSIVGENGGFCGQPQLSDVTSLQKTGTMASADMPLPALFDGAQTDANAADHPSNLKGGRPAVTATGFERAAVAGDPDITQWLGVLVELKDVQTTTECIDYFMTNPDRWQDFGYWEVTGGAEIGTLFDRTFGGFWSGVQFAGPRSCNDAATTGKCEDSRENGQTFTSLTGIVNYSFDVYRVNPRTTADIAPDTLFVAEDTGTCAAP